MTPTGSGEGLKVLGIRAGGRHRIATIVTGTWLAGLEKPLADCLDNAFIFELADVLWTFGSFVKHGIARSPLVVVNSDNGCCGVAHVRNALGSLWDRCLG